MWPSVELKAQLTKYAVAGEIVLRTERNPYLEISYKGANKLISEKWNVKIYKSGKIVTTDMNTLELIRDGKLKPADQTLKVIQVDDSGWGSPLLGVMVGVTCDGEVHTKMVDVQYFQHPKFDTKEYMKAYADAGWSIISEIIKANPETHRIEICTGYVNEGLKKLLIGKGFDVRVTEIKGLLQDSMEKMFMNKIKEITGVDLGYDPKALKDKKEIAKRYYAAVDWCRHNNPSLLKTGWGSIQL